MRIKQIKLICIPNKTGNVRINVTLGRAGVTTVTPEKQEILHVLSVSVALVIRHAKRMPRITMSFVTYMALPYFSTSSHKRHGFRVKVAEHKMRVLIFSKFLSETILVLRRNQRNITKCSCKVPVILFRFQ